jgi:hypothetical protein
MSKRKIIIAALLCVALASCSFIVYATYPIWSGQGKAHVTEATLSDVLVNGEHEVTVSKNTNVTLTTTLSDGLASVPVDFYANNTKIGSNSTGASGTAMFQYNMTVVGTFCFNATCSHP